MEYVLRTFGLSKKYKGRLVLDNVNMNIAKGDIYGFVGENGSGKTTIIRLITALAKPDGGNFELFGINNDSPKILDARKRIGAIVETPSIYLNMSAKDNLNMQCEILGVKDNAKSLSVLRDVGLEALYDDKKRAGNFSLGMRQRLGIAMALLGDPEFIILDEPMNGLDPAGIAQIRELILKLNKEKNITFLISSHILTELALVANKYGIITHGKLIKEISEEQLKRECRRTTIIEVKEQDKLYQLIENKYACVEHVVISNGIKIYGEIDLNALIVEIVNAGITLNNINCFDTSIEEYYFSLIGGVTNG